MENPIITEIGQLVTRCEKHQKALGLSDNAFAVKYRDFVGSSKTWRQRLCGGNYEGVKLDRILKKLRNFVSLLDGGAAMEQIYDDLPIFQQFIGRYNRLQSARTDRRVMVFLGETGVGKSVCARHILRESPSETAYVRCQPTWKDNHLAILNGILRALGKDQVSRKAKALEMVLEHLKSNPMTVIFDEAHDGGVVLLKLIKSLVDETPCKFIVMAYPTLWKRMLLASSDAHAEARQLFGRTQKPVFDRYAGGTTADNIEVFLKRSTALNGSSKDVAAQILEIVRHNGNLRLVADIVDAADALYMETEEELDGPKVIKLAQELSNPGGAK